MDLSVLTFAKELKPLPVSNAAVFYCVPGMGADSWGNSRTAKAAVVNKLCLIANKSSPSANKGQLFAYRGP
jgi:hypothetical protein